MDVGLLAGECAGNGAMVGLGVGCAKVAAHAARPTAANVAAIPSVRRLVVNMSESTPSGATPLADATRQRYCHWIAVQPSGARSEVQVSPALVVRMRSGH